MGISLDIPPLRLNASDILSPRELKLAVRKVSTGGHAVAEISVLKPVTEIRHRVMDRSPRC